jgi:hypothetical protein
MFKLEVRKEMLLSPLGNDLIVYVSYITGYVGISVTTLKTRDVHASNICIYHRIYGSNTWNIPYMSEQIFQGKKYHRRM